MARDMFITLLANYTHRFFFFFFKCSLGDTLHKEDSDAVSPPCFYSVLFIILHSGVVFLIKYLSFKNEKT